MVENANVNNNASVVVVGRTAPVPPGQQPMSKSIPVVLASDQTPIPVVEQNKVLSEVSLSLLGIPRSETALGIFADVNTYDVNPSEWSAQPNTVENLTIDGVGPQTWGLNHLPTESGALIQAPMDRVVTLTSKRFFRYQPGRVSSATFGVKNKVLAPSNLSTKGYPANGTIKKYGIYDKYDGYYWEARHDGVGDNFAVVRRTQSLNTQNPLPYGNDPGEQKTDYATLGTANDQPGDLVVMRDGLVHVHAAVYDPSLLKASVRINFDSTSSIDAGADTITLSDPDLLMFNRQVLLYLDNGNSASVGLTTGQAYFVEVVSGTTTKVIKLHATWALGAAISLNTATSSTRTFVLLTEKLSFDSSLIDGDSADETITLDVDNFTQVSPWLQDTGNATLPISDNTTVVLADTQTSLTVNSRYLLKISDSANNKIKVYSNAATPVLQNLTAGSGIKNFWRVKFEALSSALGVNETNNTVQFNSGELVYDVRENQAVVVTSAGAGLTEGAVYFVRNLNPYASPITFQLSASQGGSVVDLTNTTAPGLLFLIPEPHAFHVPLRSDALPYGTSEAVTGMFPYKYKTNNNTGDSIAGLIDTQLADTDAGQADLKTQMDTVNNKLFYNWIRDNVDPAYYAVYEYRVPRSRFSHEKLNGENQVVLYSDSVLNNRPGAPVFNSAGDVATYQSVWDLDFTKVTMFKVDFSWYGAVGALFLAYVPVGNGEARWVRVHHLRASNQLKVASLGNAFLPITYQVYGGGSERNWGYLTGDRQNNGYGGSYSEFLVKYGASYYIDGGDRGTTRLFSYSRPDFKDVYGQQSSLSFTYDGSTSTDPFIYTTTDISTYGSFFQNARVLTDQGDQNVFVTYYSQDGVNYRLHLNKLLTAPASGIRVIADRAAPVLGIKCKDFITSSEGAQVRNRTQIYPTKLSVGASTVTGGVAVIGLKKSPLFQTTTTLPTGTLTVTSANLIQNGSNPVLLQDVNMVGTYLDTFGRIYGWFRCRPVVNNVVNDTVVPISVLGILELGTDGYRFTSVNTLDGEWAIMPNQAFLIEGNYDAKADPNLANNYPTTSLTRLSAVLVDSEQRCPIPGTGQAVTTQYAPTGGTEFDLTTYFDYNKDYLSFPLTDQVESVYVLASSAQALGAPVAVSAQLTASLTWEEQ